MSVRFDLQAIGIESTPRFVINGRMAPRRWAVRPT